MTYKNSNAALEAQTGIQELNLQEIDEVSGGRSAALRRVARWVVESAAWDAAMHFAGNINVASIGDPMDTKLGIGPTNLQQ